MGIIAPQNLTSKGNFIERTKLKFLSRTLFKGEAERKSQNLHDVLKPDSDIKTEKNEVKKTKSPLFAPRPRFGFNFGKRNRNLDKKKNFFGVKETDNSQSIEEMEPIKDPATVKRPNLNISTFSRKGLKKTFPRILSQSAADEDQGETTKQKQTDEATIEGSASPEPLSSQPTTTRATSTAVLTESTTTTAVTSKEI